MHTRRPFALFVSLLALPALHADEPVMLDPVTVSAPLPDDALLTQPTPITAYSGALLTSAGVTTYEELAPLVPGLFASAQAVNNISLNLRGLTTDAGDPRVSTRVPVFQDGVVVSSPRGGGTALFDVQGVEVLKGPQPAAFGRAAQNGAVSILSNRARNETSGEFTAGFGDYSTRLAGGYYNAPLVTDKLFVRAAFTLAQSDGYVNNLAPGAESLQGRDTLALRTSLRWQPAPDTTADLIIDHQHDTPPGIAFKSMVLPTSAGDTDPYSATELNRGDDLFTHRKLWGVTGIVRHPLGPDWDLSSTSAFRAVDSRDEFDADGSGLYLYEFGEKTRDRQLSQELRLNYDAGGRLTAMIGAGVLHQTGSQKAILRTDENVLWTVLTHTPPPGPLLTDYQESYTGDSEMLAGDLFGRTDCTLTDKLTVGASLRVTQENITSGYQSLPAPVPGNIDFLLPAAGGGNNAFRPTSGRLEADDDYTSWSGRADARYAFTPLHQAYASVSRGRRPPVITFNQTTFAEEKLHEESVWNYETGFKGATASRRIQYGVSVFQYYYDHFQTERITAGTTQPFDGGRARGQGLEVTLQGSVNEHLSLFASYGFTDTRFAARGDDGEPQAFAGNSFRLTSRHAISFGGTVLIPAGDRGSVFITPVVQYRSEQFFEDDNANLGGTAINPALPAYMLRQGGFTIVNLRVGYRPRHGRWEVAAYVNNLLDKDYLIDAGNTGLQFGLPTSTRGAPRIAGLQATARF